MGEREVAEGGLNRAVFLDRDGVLNEVVVRDGKPYPPESVESFRLYPEAEACCTRLREEGFLLVLVTNQPDVGRGKQRKEVVEEMHRGLMEKLALDRIEVCFDPGGGPEERRRKPQPGMLLDAAEELNINLERSFLIGDRWRDIDCAAAAGCRSIFIDRGYREELRESPDATVNNLQEAVEVICSRSEFNPLA